MRAIMVMMRVSAGATNLRLALGTCGCFQQINNNSHNSHNSHNEPKAKNSSKRIIFSETPKMAPHMNDDNDVILKSSDDVDVDVDVDVHVDVARRRGSGSTSRISDPTTTTTPTATRMVGNDDTDIEIDDAAVRNDRSFLKRKWWQPLGQSDLNGNMRNIREVLHATMTPPPTTPHEPAGRTSLPSPPSMCLPPVPASTSLCLPQRPSLCPSVVSPTPPPRSQQQETSPGRRTVISGGRQNHQQRHTKTSSSKPKSVHFAPLVKKKTIKHYKDFSDEEFSLTWLTSEELHGILQDCIKTVKMMVRGELILEDVDGLCVRGLEFKTPEGSRERKANKARGFQAVLTEQAVKKSKGGGGGGANANANASAISGRRQQQQQDSLPLRLSMLYRDATRHVRRRARAMAQKDEQAARTIYNESNVNTSAGTADCRLDIVVCWNGEEAVPEVSVPSTPAPNLKISRKTGAGPQPRRFATSSPTTVYDPLDGWSSPLMALEQQQQQYDQN